MDSQVCDYSDIKLLQKSFINLLKTDKKMGKSDIVKHEKEKLCIISIQQKENYNKSHNKLCSSTNIKGLQKIFLKEDYNENPLLINHNISTLNNNICFINMLLNYELINCIVQKNDYFVFPQEELQNNIIDQIALCDNVIINIDHFFNSNENIDDKYNCDDALIKQLAYVIVHIGYYIHLINVNQNNKFKLIKIKSKNRDQIEVAVTFLKDYFKEIMISENVNCDEIIKKIKEKQAIEENLKEKFGGIRLNTILLKRNIKNISKNKMLNTQKYLKKYFDHCYIGNDTFEAILDFEHILNIFELLYKKPNEMQYGQVSLDKLKNIVIGIPEEEKKKKNKKNKEKVDDDDKDDDDDHDVIKFSMSSLQDSSQRYISRKFLEEASNKFIEVILRDLFFYNFNKKGENSINLINKNVDIKVEFNKILISKIYTAITEILSKFYDVENVEVNQMNDSTVYTFNALKEKRKGSKRKIEEEEEEEDEEEEEEEEFKIGKKEATEMMREKKKRKAKKDNK